MTSPEYQAPTWVNEDDPDFVEGVSPDLGAGYLNQLAGAVEGHGQRLGAAESDVANLQATALDQADGDARYILQSNAAGFAPAEATANALTGKQPLDADLTALAGLDSATAGTVASDGAGWVKKTYAQMRTALGLSTIATSGKIADATDLTAAGAVAGKAVAVTAVDGSGVATHGYVEAPQMLPAAASWKWRRCLARVRSGTADAKILFVGDSTTGGVGVTDLTQGSPGSYPYQVAALLAAAGIAAVRGLGVPGPNTSNEDTRWSLGGAWSHATSFGWGNSGALKLASGSTGTLTYTDPVLADRYDVYFLRSVSSGTLSITATGGTTVNQATASGTRALEKVTVSATSASTSNIVSMTGSGGDVYVLGVEPWLSTTKRLRVANAGQGSSRAVTGWAATGADAAWNSQSAIKAYAPDLTVISLGINDANDQQSVSAYTTALSTLVTAAQVSGDVILVPPFPPRSTATANQQTNIPLYRAAVLALGLPVVDVTARWGSADTAAANGMYFDSVHPNGLGYADIAHMVASRLLTA